MFHKTACVFHTAYVYVLDFTGRIGPRFGLQALSLTHAREALLQFNIFSSPSCDVFNPELLLSVCDRSVRI